MRARVALTVCLPRSCSYSISISTFSHQDTNLRSFWFSKKRPTTMRGEDRKVKARRERQRKNVRRYTLAGTLPGLLYGIADKCTLEEGEVVGAAVVVRTVLRTHCG